MRNACVSVLVAFLFFVAAGVVSPPVVRADQSDRASALVAPLREIGRATATTPFCRDFALGAAPAARAAIAFESRWNLAERDLAAFDAGNELAKLHAVALLEDDLHVLALAARSGADELAALRSVSLASPAASRAEVVQFADALSGAQARQLQMTRDFARVVGALAEMPVANSGDESLGVSRMNEFVNARAPRTALASTMVDSGVGGDAFSVLGDDFVARDLVRAGRHAQAVQALESCR